MLIAESAGLFQPEYVAKCLIDDAVVRIPSLSNLCMELKFYCLLKRSKNPKLMPWNKITQNQIKSNKAKQIKAIPKNLDKSWLILQNFILEYFVYCGEWTSLPDNKHVVLF